MRDDHRFEAFVRALAHRPTRRTALVGGLAAALGGLRVGRVRPSGLAQDRATPVASPGATPAASPGPLDLLGGTPVAADMLGRLGDGCRDGQTGIGRRESCAGHAICPAGSLACSVSLCCSGTCRYWLAPNWNSGNLPAGPGWYCD